MTLHFVSYMVLFLIDLVHLETYFCLFKLLTIRLTFFIPLISTHLITNIISNLDVKFLLNFISKL